MSTGSRVQIISVVLKQECFFSGTAMVTAVLSELLNNNSSQH